MDTRPLAAAAMVCVLACRPGFDLPSDAKVSCATSDGCPDPLVCSRGFCVPVGSISTGKKCQTDGDCDDQVFCNGAERCERGWCVAPVPPCGSSFECVVSTCVEGAGGQGSCKVAPDHARCAQGQFCSPTDGCVPGQPCLADADCRDGSECNGQEICSGYHCVPGALPNLDDGDVCTLDGCDDARSAKGLDAVFHVADPSRDANTCDKAGLAGPGICIAAQGGCVASVCGDRFVDANAQEQCDDANANPNDGCEGCRHTVWTPALVAGQGPSAGDPRQFALGPVFGVAFDRGGNLVVCDGGRNQILRVDAATGQTTVVAGTGRTGFSGDGGPATGADLDTPSNPAIDGHGAIYFAEMTNHRVRRISPEGIIDTVAGDGTGAFRGDGGPATRASLSSPYAVALGPDGRLFIADSDNNRVRVVEADGTIRTFAGNGASAFNGDNRPATSAALDWPGGVAVGPQGEVYVSEMGGNRVRKIGAGGTITTVAGTGTAGFRGDGGPATAAWLSWPTGVAVSATGELLFADRDNQRARLVRADGTIATVAGNGTQGFGGDGGPATSALLSQPEVVAFDAQGRAVIGDSQNLRVRRVEAGTISTMVGGRATAVGDGGPAERAVLNQPFQVVVDDQGRLLVGELDRVRCVGCAASGQVSTLAGGNPLGSLDAGPATSAMFRGGGGVALDAAGNLYVADAFQNRVVKIDPAGNLTPFAGTGARGYAGDGGPAAAAELDWPNTVSFDAMGRVLIAEIGNNVVRRVEAGIITTIVGKGPNSPGYSGDGGPASAASLDQPCFVLPGPGNVLYVADMGNHAVRKISSTGVITTIAGDGNAGFGGDGGPATGARLNYPCGLALDSTGALLVADQQNHRVRSVAANGAIRTIAGSGVRGSDGDYGPATAAQLSFPGTVTVDGSRILVADTFNGRVRSIAADGTITTLVGPVDAPGDGLLAGSSLGAPSQLAQMGSTWLVADGAHVRGLDPAAGALSTLAGYPGGLPTSGIDARKAALLDVGGVAYDAAASRVYLSERGGHRLRWLDTSSSPWTIHALTGSAGSPGHADGPCAAASFHSPSGLLFDAAKRRLFVADSGNHVVRAVDVDSCSVSTVAGTPRFAGFFGDGGPASTALLDGPEALCSGPDGSLYVADTGNDRVRRIDAAGNIQTVLGDGSAASSGTGTPPQLYPVDGPRGLALDGYGNLFVSSRDSVRLVTDVASGSGVASTLYGVPRREAFPASVTRCLTGIAVLPGAADSRLWVLDECAGYLVQLDRARAP
ncbi:MAG TPA: hypothetical protein VGK67_05780 [Myxococcales bacterium]|jgi:sugar lactone lactonase YvrE